MIATYNQHTKLVGAYLLEKGKGGMSQCLELHAGYSWLK